MFRRNNSNRRRYNRSTKPRGRQLARTRNGITQRASGTSHQDNVRQVRKFQIFHSLPVSNAGLDYAFGLTSFNINGNESPLKPLLQSYAKVYEQYRIRKINIRAQVGKGFDNDKRIKTLVGCRVDVDNQDTTISVSNLQAINSAENTVLRTFTQRGNILLAKYRPQCRVNTTASMPILPNTLQFFPIGDSPTHFWKGAIITVMLPEPTIQPNSLAITLMAEVDVEFRGRVTNPEIFTLNTVNQTPFPVTFDDSGDLATLRTKFLTGMYFPGTGFETINVANIGTSVTTEEILGAEYRDQNTQLWYTILDYSNPNDFFGANLRD